MMFKEYEKDKKEQRITRLVNKSKERWLASPSLRPQTMFFSLFQVVKINLKGKEESVKTRA